MSKIYLGGFRTLKDNKEGRKILPKKDSKKKKEEPTILWILKTAKVINNERERKLSKTRHSEAMNLGVRFAPDIIFYSPVPELKPALATIKSFSNLDTVLKEEPRLSFGHYADLFGDSFMQSLKSMHEKQRVVEVLKHPEALQIAILELGLITLLLRRPENKEKKILLLSHAGIVEALERYILRVAKVDIDILNDRAGFLEGLKFSLEDDNIFVKVPHCNLTFLLHI